MAKRNNIVPTRTPEEIQETGNIIFDNLLEEIRAAFKDLKINKRSEEDQKDRGIDMQIELISKPNEKTLDTFKLQIKATDKPIVPLKSTIYKGLISFPIEHRHIEYYQHEIYFSLVFILCDNSNKTVYWYPIQLDNTLEDRLEKSKAQNKKSLQIYIDPRKILNPSNFLEFIKDLEVSKTSQFFKVTVNNENSLTLENDFKVDRTQPLLDQLYEVFEYLYEEVQYVPINLLVQHYPLKISENQPAYYQQFKLYTDNDDLVAMLDTFKVLKDGTSINFTDTAYIKDVKDYEKKAKTILSKLSQNLIYSIVSHKSRKEVSTRYFNHNNCNCSACSYSMLKIPQAISKLQEVGNKTLDELMVIAYMHYTLGDFLKSAELFDRINKQAVKEKKKTLIMITQFNLIRLGKLIRRAYFDNEIIEHAKKLTEINLDLSVYKERNRSYHRKLFNYIKDASFYSDSAYEIQTALLKLRSEYQSFIDGGKFSTHSFHELLIGFAQINSFISGNKIIYDRFGEYHIQMEEFTEGLFIALALRETNSYVINEFNDYHINQLIFDGNHKLIWRYFNKYHFKYIPYNAEKGKFFEMISNLFANHDSFINAYKSYASDDGSFWRNRYPEIFNNCLSLAAMLQMNDSQAEKIARGIKDCISSSILLSPDTYVQVNSFFNSKRNQLTTELLKELIFFFLQKDDMYLERRIQILIAELKLRNETLIFSTKQRKDLFKFALEGKNDKLEYFNTLTYFYPVVDKKLKLAIRKRITSQLLAKFDAYNYYNSVIYDVLTFEGSEFLQNFIETTHPDRSKHSFRNSFYGPQENEYPLFDMFLNLCFKFELKPNEITGKQITGYGNYYDWLLDLDGFDYTKFKISWLVLYPTKYYFQQFAKSQVLRKTMESYLKNNRDQRIERMYFDIYNVQVNELEVDF